MFRYAWLLTLTFATGCASMQDMFCGLVEPDSYVLVSMARCETMQVSFDRDVEADFSLLESYDWLAVQHPRSAESGSHAASLVNAWVTDAVDTELARRGYGLDHEVPDFLVSYEVPLEMRGTLILTVVHADSHELIWRGQASDEAYPARNSTAWEERIRSAAGMLLEQFPPHRDE